MTCSTLALTIDRYIYLVYTLFIEIPRQHAKKVVSDSPGLVDFAIGLVNSVLNLPDGQVKIFQRSKITEVL